MKHHSLLEELARENRRAYTHALVWETVAVVLMIVAIVAAIADWANPTAFAGTSIAAATLALYRGGK